MHYDIFNCTHELRVFDLHHGTLQCSIPVYETSQIPVLRLQDEERNIPQTVRDVVALRSHEITENFNPPIHEHWFPEPNISTGMS